MADLAGLWHPRPAFLVCGGPSLQTYPAEAFQRRGVLTLGINNASAVLPCTAGTWSDGQQKFHHSLYFDPKHMMFAPTPKLGKTVRVKRPDGFHNTDVLIRDCPNIWGVNRSTRFIPDQFFSTWWCHWGYGGKHQKTCEHYQDDFHSRITMLLGLRLLHYLGCPRVYMIGVDFRDKQYVWGDALSHGNGLWVKINRFLDALVPVFKKYDYQVFNCYSDSGCDVFPYVPFEDALADCQGPLAGDPIDLADWYNKTIQVEHAQRFPDPLPLQSILSPSSS